MQVNEPPTVEVGRVREAQILYYRCLADLGIGELPDTSNLDLLVIRTINNLAALHTQLSNLENIEHTLKLFQMEAGK